MRGDGKVDGSRDGWRRTRDILSVSLLSITFHLHSFSKYDMLSVTWRRSLTQPTFPLFFIMAALSGKFP